MLLSGTNCRTKFVPKGPNYGSGGQSPTPHRGIQGFIPGNDPGFGLTISPLPCLCHSSTGPQSSASTCHYCKKEKRTMTGNFQTHQCSCKQQRAQKQSICSILVLQMANLNETALLNFEVFEVSEQDDRRINFSFKTGT